MARSLGPRVAMLGLVLLFAGCYVHGTFLSVTRADPAAPFTAREQETARAIVVELGRAAGFWETDAAKKLAARPSSSPYVDFVSLGAPGGNREQRSVTILGSLRKDHREIRIAVGDDARGDLLPAAQQMVDELRAALGRAFPDARVEVTSRRQLRGFAP